MSLSIVESFLFRSGRLCLSHFSNSMIFLFGILFSFCFINLSLAYFGFWICVYMYCFVFSLYVYFIVVWFFFNKRKRTEKSWSWVCREFGRTWKEFRQGIGMSRIYGMKTFFQLKKVYQVWIYKKLVWIKQPATLSS